MRTLVLLLGSVVGVAAFGAARIPAATAPDDHTDHVVVHVAAGGGLAGAAQQAAGIPAAGPVAAARIASSPRHGEWATIKVGPTDSVVAWVVYPQRREKAPVVVVIHENTGLTTWARGVADQLAADGFIGIAPDLLTMRRTGNLTNEWTADSGRAAINTVTNEQVQASLDAVAKYGMSLPAALPKYGIVGFCWGGARSFLHAVHAPSLGAAVVYYGSPPTTDQMTSIKAPVLGLYGGNDARITSTVPATDSAMKKLSKTYEFQVFEGAGHGFLRGQEAEGGPNLNAAKEAWPKTIAWFQAKLGA